MDDENDKVCWLVSWESRRDSYIPPDYQDWSGVVVTMGQTCVNQNYVNTDTCHSDLRQCGTGSQPSSVSLSDKIARKLFRKKRKEMLGGNNDR